MLHLDLLLSPHQNQVEYLAAHYHDTVANGEWTFHNEVGRGVLRHYPLPLDLTAYTYELELGQPMAFDTVNPADSGLYCVFVNLGTEAVTKTVGGETVVVQKDMPGGVFFYSPDIHISQVNQALGAYAFVCLTFTRAGLASLLPPQILATYFAEAQSFHLFEELTLTMEEQLRPLVAGTPHPLDPLTVYSRVLAFLHLLVGQLQQRALTPANRLLRPDVEKLFWVRAQLETHYANPPCLAELAAEVSLSSTTLTRHFVQYFGRTVGQYAQYARVHKARELLASGRYSVSEAGYAVGYENLTHFGRAFAKHFNCRPKDFLAAALKQVLVSG